MENWQDEGIILQHKLIGEEGACGIFFTSQHGLYKGFVPTKSAQKTSSFYVVGNVFNLRWQARLPHQLGRFQLEITSSIFPYIINSPLKLMVLEQAVSLISLVLPERNPYPIIYTNFVTALNFLRTPETNIWLAAYLKFELLLLREVGFGLDFSGCPIAKEKSAPLTHISPRTGRAVSDLAASLYPGKLLIFPRFLDPTVSYDHLSSSDITNDDLAHGWALLSFFITKYLPITNRPEIHSLRNNIRSGIVAEVVGRGRRIASLSLLPTS